MHVDEIKCDINFYNLVLAVENLNSFRYILKKASMLITNLIRVLIFKWLQTLDLIQRCYTQSNCAPIPPTCFRDADI